MPSSLQHPGSAPVIATGVFLFNKPIPYILTEPYPYIAFCYFKVYLTPLPAPVFFRIFFSIRLFRVRTALLFSISAAFSISDLDIFSFPLRMLTRYSSSLIPTGRGYSLEVPADEIYATLNGNEIDIAKNFTLSYGENLNIGEFQDSPLYFFISYSFEYFILTFQFHFFICKQAFCFQYSLNSLRWIHCMIWQKQPFQFLWLYDLIDLHGS